MLILALAGCSRTHYRQRADADTYAVLVEKSAGTPWTVGPGFRIWPARASRFYDPTPRDDPLLPMPAPQLYGYQLGELPLRDRARFRPHAAGDSPSVEELAPGSLAPVTSASGAGEGAVLPAAHLQDVRPIGPVEAPTSEPVADLPQPATASQRGELRVVAIPGIFWESVPAPCLVRMLEFSSVREEHRRTFGDGFAGDLRDPSPRLALEDIVELAQINNRAFQRQKEILYTVALRLTQERFAYQLKFSSAGNGTDANFSHRRNGGVTDDGLSVPTRATIDQVTATGGDLLARFANDVVLTFNGPNGFAADVGSDLLFDVSQSVLQRDIVFESLTQAERDVVYAARDFARFRKQLFRDLAVQYYRLLLAYRDIEISTQDYFSNVRGFNQAEAEYRAGRLPRIQVDQFEQDALRGRSRLIAQCTTLEGDLDDLKFLIGLPPETPVNLDLTELDQISLRDEAVVAGQLVRRAQRSLLAELEQESPDSLVLVSGAAVLADRLLTWTRLQLELGIVHADGEEELTTVQRRLATEGARLQVEFHRRALTTLREQPEASAPLIYRRTMELADSLLSLAARQLERADAGDARLADAELPEAYRHRLRDLRGRFDRIRTELGEMTSADSILGMTRAANELLREADRLVDEMDERMQLTELDSQRQPQLPMIRETVERLLEYSRQSLAGSSVGLTPVAIDTDEAMLTALVQRFDVMNQRGALADAWRRIKLAGDDLRSILNLNATQLVRTQSDVNQPLDFTWDESETRLGLSFDAPLNRRAQRNAFRQSLINYQLALRNLMALEDSIKLAVRDNLRELQLDREQYRISVASAALAFERVVSTRLELSLGRKNVTARDVLEARAAYTASLRTVASEHIGYILDRIDLFLDLELLQVDENGFWPHVYDEGYHPVANLVPPVAGPAYGELPAGVWQSKAVRRMLAVPQGVCGAVVAATGPEADAAPAMQPAVASDLPPSERQ